MVKINDLVLKITKTVKRWKKIVSGRVTKYRGGFGLHCVHKWRVWAFLTSDSGAEYRSGGFGLNPSLQVAAVLNTGDFGLISVTVAMGTVAGLGLIERHL